MRIIPHFVFPIFACALFSGCAELGPTRIIGDTAGAVGGALLGNALAKGNPLITAAASGGGVILSEALQAGSTSAQQKSYSSGYEKGRSDSAKQRFQALSDRQRIAPQSNDEANVRLFDLPLPERQINGVTFAPATAVLRIQE